MNERKLKLVMSGLVVLHLMLASLHGVAHQRMSIGLEPWQGGFVGSVILAGPLVALALLWTSRQEVGAVLLAACMAGSSVFGICYHFFLPSSDNVFFLRESEWGRWFTTTALLLAIIETSCCIWCAWLLKSGRAKLAPHNG